LNIIFLETFYSKHSIYLCYKLLANLVYKPQLIIDKILTRTGFLQLDKALANLY
jgi:hypothetical protein